MKVAFVNDSCEHLGIEYISAVLKQAGHETKLFVDPLLFDDEFITVKSLNRLFDFKWRIIKQLREYQPDLIGMSVVTSFYPWAAHIAHLIKQNMDVPVIMGGIHPTSVPERVMANQDVDMVCIGEGEYPFLELAESMAQGKINTRIRNIWFKEGRQLIKNEVRPPLEDLDVLPFPDKDLYYSASPHFSQCYYIAASRGCPHACSYCCNSYLRHLYNGKHKYVRQRSVNHVVAELKWAKERYRVEPVFFLDDCFGYDLDWLEEFSVKYGREIGAKFYCMMFPTDKMERALKYLKQAGCGEIEIGVQSWDEGVRKDIFHRRVSNATMLKTMRLIKQEKINLVTGDILGYPGQKEEHILQAARIYSELKPSRSYPFILKYYPKTDITNQALEDGHLSPENYEKIIDGEYGKYLSKDGSMTEKDVLQYLLLFLLVRVFPPRVSQWMIRKRFYRHFPVFLTPAVISILSNFSTATFESKVNRRSAFTRYTYFLRNKIFKLNQ